MHVVGIVLHPRRDSAEAVAAILEWAARRKIQVLGITAEIERLNCAAIGVSDAELGQRADLVVGLGGDGTMLRAMRLVDRQRPPVLGVNLGKLGFLAEVDVPDLPAALTTLDAGEFTIEPRLAVDAVIGDRWSRRSTTSCWSGFPATRPRRWPSWPAAIRSSAMPPTPSWSRRRPGRPPTASRPAARSSARRWMPCWSRLPRRTRPTTGAWSCRCRTAWCWRYCRTAAGWPSRWTAQLAAEVSPGDRIEVRPRPGAAHVVRFGRSTFYERARRKLRLADSAEIPVD